MVEHSEIIGNPVGVRVPEKINSDQFKWQGRVRAVLPSGYVTPVGYYDSPLSRREGIHGDGRIVVGNNRYSLDIYGRRARRRGIGSGNAFMITDYVYRKIKNHKKYKRGMNLYKMILAYSSFTYRQEGLLGYKDEVRAGRWFGRSSSSYIVIGKDDWKYTDPNMETRKGKKSRARIESIVNHFMDATLNPFFLTHMILKQIKWEKKFVKNMPLNDVGSLNQFRDGNKVIQYKAGKVNKYMSQNTFTTLAKMSPNNAYNKSNNRILFKNPFTRENVKVGDIKYIILKNAATKIQSTVRGKKARNLVQTQTRRKLLANAAMKRHTI